MAKQMIEFRCLVISPGDVQEARNAIQQAILSWNAQAGRGRGVRIEPVMWESHVRPSIGDSPQAVVNDQVTESSDLGIAVFWARLGSPTGSHKSGSIEEIYLLHRRGAPVMVYFSNEPVKLAEIETSQLDSLKQFRLEISKKAIVGEFDSVDRLRELVVGHLTSQVDDLLRMSFPHGKPSDVLSSPLLDVRVTLAAAIPTVELGDARLKVIIVLKIENHSSADFFFGGNIVFELDGGSVLQPMRDGITGEWFIPKVINPGDSISYNFSAQVIIDQAKNAGKQIACARIVDKIGREFRSSKENTKACLHNAAMLLKE